MKRLWIHELFKVFDFGINGLVHNKNIGSLKKRCWMRSFICAGTKPMKNVLSKQSKRKNSDFVWDSIYLHCAHPPQTAQILLIFGFMHSRVAARPWLWLKWVALSCSHRVCFLVHMLKLHAWRELVWHLWEARARRIDCHHSCSRTTFEDSRSMSRNRIQFVLHFAGVTIVWTLYCCFASLTMAAAELTEFEMRS